MFEEWLRHDVGQVYVQLFDVTLDASFGRHLLCIHAPTCGYGPAFEHNGDLYSRDRFVEPKYKLANIHQTHMLKLVASPEQRKFGNDKRDTLTQQCQNCKVRNWCNGGCTKDRFALSKDGEPGQNYLCAGLEKFFMHTGPTFNVMAQLIQKGHAPADVMDTIAALDAQRDPYQPCTCGSKIKVTLLSRQCRSTGRVRIRARSEIDRNCVDRSIPSGAPMNQPYNILFILTDQERFFRPGELPEGYSLPGHERLWKQGTRFVNHRINSCVCTPSRSVIYTGQHIQQTRMFDNTNFPWIQSMSPELRTVGDMLREAGYYTAYKGKWHLTKEFETVNELGHLTKIFTQEMEGYGFSDYFGVGDIIAHDRGGYLHDGITGAMAGSWLRGKGRDLADEQKPWFLAVNFVNPHDVMFYDTDVGTPVVKRRGLSPIARDPVDPLYAAQWQFDLPQSHDHALDAPGRPAAHRDFLASHDAMVGGIANEPARWRRRHNYYLNCLRDADRNIAALLAEVDAAGMADSTIIVMTADHGDMDGAHQLHAKGAVGYREQNNVPLVVVHPDHPGGRQCRAVTSHLDLAPTLVGLTGVPGDRQAAIAKGLPGKDFSGLLAAPAAAGPDAIRDGMLFNYNMFAYLDGEFLRTAVEKLHQGMKPAELKSSGLRPDMTKRGAVRSVFDGRHVFTRYFSPKQHNRPTSLEEIEQFNDVELFDVEADPLEVNNLATDARRNGELMLAMNAKLNRLIDTEVGEDNGQMLPGGADAGWEVSPETMAGA